MLARLRSLMRAWFGRTQFERDMSEEMRFHMDAYARDLVQSGVAPLEATRRARLAFGGVEGLKEEARRSRGLRYVDELSQDLRFGVRQMRKTPGVTAAVVISLALGIGANTAIFSLLDFVVINRLRVHAADQLYFIGHGRTDTSSNYPLLARYQGRVDAFSGITAYNIQQFKLSTPAATELADGQYVSGNYHDVLGVRFALGRGFRDEPDAPSDRSQIAVISAGFWQRQLGGDPDIIGRPLVVEGRTVTIVGVTAPGFNGLKPGAHLDVTLPLGFRMLDDLEFATMRDTWTSLTIVGRAQSGFSPEQLVSALNTVFQPFWLEPENAWIRTPANMTRQARVSPASKGQQTLRNLYSEPLEIMMGMVGLVLLIACTNVANLLSARGIARRRELAVRLSIGAGRSRLVRQLLTESLLLSTAAGTLGLFVAMWSTSAIGAILNGGSLPTFVDVELNWRVLGFTFGVSAVTGLFFGLLPAMTATRIDVASSLTPHRTSGGRLRRLASAKVLVAMQVATSALLLVGCGLLVRSLFNLKTQEYGFRTDKLLLFYFDTRGTQAEVMQLYTPLLERLQTLPGVRAATVSTMSPLATNNETRGIQIEGRPAGERHSAVNNRVTRDYFSTLEIPILRGRGITAEDTARTPSVAVVNETMARGLFDDNPIGRVFAFSSFADRPVRIVGVARDVRIFNLRDSIQPMVYVALDQVEEPQKRLTAVVRTEGLPRDFEASVREAVRAVSPDLLVTYVRTMDEQIDVSLTRERLLAMLSGAFGILAVVLAGVGLYGVIGYGVVRRLREFSIRLALGATRTEIVSRVLRETFVVLGAGLALGLLAAIWSSKLVATFLFGLAPSDTGTFAAAGGLLLLVAIVAGYLPARRAAMAAPVQALRND